VNPSLRHAHHARIVILAVLALGVFAGVATRLAEIAVWRHGHFGERASRRQGRSVEVLPRRGEVLDRRGRVLAVSDLRETLNVNTGVVDADVQRQVAHACAEILDEPVRRFDRRLEHGGRVPLARQMETEQAQRLREFFRRREFITHERLYFTLETKRLYPMGSLAASVIGFTRPDDTGDNDGLVGIEAAMNGHLRGKAIRERLLHDGARRPMEPMTPEVLIASAGCQVHLTVDSEIQRVAEDALGEAVTKYEADWGTAVVLAPGTAEILALANWPTFDLNRHGRETEASKRNHAIMTPIDPGSVMKIFTFAAAMEEGLIQEDEIIDCHRGRWRHPVWGFNVTDDESHPLGTVPLRQAFALSSNIATVQVADRLGAASLVDHLRAFGFGQGTQVGLRGEHTGALRAAGKWSTPDHRAIPTGQGMSTTALQSAAALAAIANGGVWQTPRIVRKVEDATGQEVAFEFENGRRRVISSLTAQRMALLMEGVVAHGTGDEAQITGVRVGGKTGTPDRYDEEAGGYRGYHATFAGFAPVDDPQVVCVVFISNPNRRIGFYGGTVAAPVFREIVAQSLRILGVPARPDAAPFEVAAQVVINATQATPAAGSSASPELTATLPGHDDAGDSPERSAGQRHMAHHAAGS
jgi:cell division protein FtsI/penicillin-binding protein 2